MYGPVWHSEPSASVIVNRLSQWFYDSLIPDHTSTRNSLNTLSSPFIAHLRKYPIDYRISRSAQGELLSSERNQRAGLRERSSRGDN